MISIRKFESKIIFMFTKINGKDQRFKISQSKFFYSGIRFAKRKTKQFFQNVIKIALDGTSDKLALVLV